MSPTIQAPAPPPGAQPQQQPPGLAANLQNYVPPQQPPADLAYTDTGQAQADIEPPPAQQQFQLTWPPHEVDAIATRVQADYRNALADHRRRIARWQDYYRRWLGSIDLPNTGEESASNMPVPYVKWNVFTAWSKQIDSLFGDDAEIVAVPVGPSDYKLDAKLSKYMTWRVFNSMKLLVPFCEFVVRKLLFGRSVAFSNWKRDVFEIEHPDTGQRHEVVDYEGPDFLPLHPDDFIVPAEEVRSLHDFSFCIRRYRTTPDELLQGEKDGEYQNITENWKQIINLAKHGLQREMEGEEIKREADDVEGILFQRPLSSGEWIMVLEWYGKWRPLIDASKDAAGADEWDFDRREMRTREYRIRYLWDLRLVIGVQDLEDLYPTLRHRRPFVESSMIKDGRYWCAGLPEMLCDLEDDLKINHNQATEAGQLAMNPPLGYRPASGLTADMIQLEPGLAIPMDNPQSDIRQIEIRADMNIATWKEQAVLGYGERLTGHSDLQLGRQEDRPNAPRTAKQTIALLEEGNVRISLDSKVLREDMAAVLAHFWDLEFLFSPPSVFFRVTEEDAGGLFEVNHGGSFLSHQERDGRYDWRLQFASSVYSREAKKERTLARYQIDMQNPMIVTNQQALWQATKQAHEALGDPNFADLVPQPPAPDISVDPKREWSLMREGDDVQIHATDDDMQHLIRHYQDMRMSDPDPHVPPEFKLKLAQHYQQHIGQLYQKRFAQAVVEQAVNAAAQLAAGGAGGVPGAAGAGAGAKPLAFAHGLYGNVPPGMPPGNPMATGPFAFSGHPEIGHEQ
jgi:hypothetical protein